MLQAPRRITRNARCTLTGTPIHPGDALYVEHAQVKRRKARYLQQAMDVDVIAPPVTIHRHETQGIGLAYSVMMAAYLDAGLFEQRAELSIAEREALIAWWDSPYGVSRVRRGLIARLRETLAESAADTEADSIIAAVVSCHTAKADPEMWATRYGRDGQWLRGCIDWCMKLAHRRGRITSVEHST